MIDEVKLRNCLCMVRMRVSFASSKFVSYLIFLQAFLYKSRYSMLLKKNSVGLFVLKFAQENRKFLLRSEFFFFNVSKAKRTSSKTYDDLEGEIFLSRFSFERIKIDYKPNKKKK